MKDPGPHRYRLKERSPGNSWVDDQINMSTLKGNAMKGNAMKGFS